MRAAAQVFERAFAVQRHVFIARDAGDDLGLVGFAQAFEVFDGLIARQHAAHHGLVLGGQLAHLFLDGDQVLGREGALVGKVVIKAVLDHWANRDLRFREKLLHRVGQQVRRRVANQLQPVGVLGRDDGEFGVLRDRVARVDQLAIDLAAERRLGQAGANGLRDFGHRDGAFELTV